MCKYERKVVDRRVLHAYYHVLEHVLAAIDPTGDWSAAHVRVRPAHNKSVKEIRARSSATRAAMKPLHVFVVLRVSLR